MNRRSTLRLMVLTLSLVSALAFGLAQGADEHEHEHAELEGVRLLLGEADSARLFVIAAEDGTVLSTFSTPGVGAVHQLPDPSLAIVLHRDDNRVTVVHSGLSAIDHGDHADLIEGNAHVLATINTGRQPTHLFARGNDVAVFNDQDGTVAWFDARLLGVSLDYVEIVARNPDHGALAVLGDHVVVGLLASGEVDVYTRAGASVAHFEGCPGLHGQAALATTVTFGCSDGVLIVQAVGGGVFTAHKVANPPASPEDARVSTLAASEDSGTLVGNFGEGFAIVDPAARTLVTYAAPATQLAGRFYDEGRYYLRLGSDGYLRSIDMTDGSVAASLEVAHAVVSAEAPRPSLAVLGDLAFVTDPEHRSVAVVDLDHWEELVHHHLPFIPSGIAVLAIPGAELH